MEDKPSEGADQSKKHRLGKRTLASTDALAVSNSEKAKAASPSKRNGADEHKGSSKHLVKRMRLSKPSTQRSDGQVEGAVSQAFRDIVNPDVSPGVASILPDIGLLLPNPQPTTGDFIQDIFKDALRSEEDLSPRDATNDGAASSLPNAGSLSDIELTAPEAEPLSTTEGLDSIWSLNDLGGEENLPPANVTYDEIIEDVLSAFGLKNYAQPPAISKEFSSSSDSGRESSMERYNPGTPDSEENYKFQKEAFDEHYQRIREEQIEEGTGKNRDGDYI